MRAKQRILEEIERLERQRRSGTLNHDQLARTCAALDALRWAVGEMGILCPSELALLP